MSYRALKTSEWNQMSIEGKSLLIERLFHSNGVFEEAMSFCEGKRLYLRGFEISTSSKDERTKEVEYVLRLLKAVFNYASTDKRIDSAIKYFDPEHCKLNIYHHRRAVITHLSYNNLVLLSADIVELIVKNASEDKLYDVLCFFERINLFVPRRSSGFYRIRELAKHIIFKKITKLEVMDKFIEFCFNEGINNRNSIKSTKRDLFFGVCAKATMTPALMPAMSALLDRRYCIGKLKFSKIKEIIQKVIGSDNDPNKLVNVALNCNRLLGRVVFYGLSIERVESATRDFLERYWPADYYYKSFSSVRINRIMYGVYACALKEK